MNKYNDNDWILISPLDMHLHLRQGEMLKSVTRHSSTLFSGAVVMPNLVPPVTSLGQVIAYKKEIEDIALGDDFLPLMTLFFREYSRQELETARKSIIGIKLYPEGITTNSDSGIHDVLTYQQVLSDMEDLDIPLMVHGETHGFVLNREREFMATYEQLACQYPKLKIIMEHISTREAIPLIDKYENIYATVTLHHLLLTLDDMAGGLLNPHLFCKPLLKNPEDRDALQAAVLSGNHKIMFGSDSAPHPVHKKECCGCAAGLFSAPVIIPMLADFFERHGKRSLLQDFISGNAQRCHHIDPPLKRIKLIREKYKVPDKIGDIIPFMAGSELPWSAKRITA